MKIRTQIERVIIIGMLCWMYGQQVPGLLRQGSIGRPALIGGAVILLAIIWGLLKRSSGLALAFGLIAAFFAIVQPIVFFLSRAHHLSAFTLAGSEAVVMIGAFCYLDLWAEWKKPNKAPEPTPTAGTPPAGQESRQP
jgi:hypothetical protein